MKFETRIHNETIVHKLKSDPGDFTQVRLGKKQAEIRFADRDYQVNDYILLNQTWSTGDEMRKGAELKYTGRANLLKITHIHSAIGMETGYVALSFIKLD